MIRNQIIKIREYCLYGIVFTVVIPNIYNYFINYKLLQDSTAQWRLAMIAISVGFFLFSLRVWLGEILKLNNKFNSRLSGWMTLYLMTNMLGVIAGYTLHTKGFMMLLFTLMFFGISDVLVRYNSFIKLIVQNGRDIIFKTVKKFSVCCLLFWSFVGSRLQFIRGGNKQ